jgi:hypothetical protein
MRRQTKHDNVSCQESLKKKNDREALKEKPTGRPGK